MNIRKFPVLLLQGFLALLPLIVTTYIGLWIFNIMKSGVDIIIPLLPEILQDNLIMMIIFKIIILIAFAIALAFLGFLARSIIGKSLLKFIKYLFSMIPGLGAIYHATEQVVSVFSGEKKNFFEHPVLVEYPSPGIWALAFNTGEIDIKTSQNDLRTFTVFLPTSPNPTSGFLALLPEDKIKSIDISTEDAIKLILTGGIVKGSNPVEDVAK